MSEPITWLNATLEGRYRIERELGEGGMATVYLAEDLKHGRKVALKVLRSSLSEAVGAERFQREIDIAAHLTHPNILPLYDSGEVGGSLYYVMPHIAGESLRDRLDRETQLPVDEAVDITRRMAAALDHAHEKGVVHRDIKPGNILLSGSEPLLADFGIAKALSAGEASGVTATGAWIGTPKYMSPEQITGDGALDHRADIYALGCVLYEMLVGTPPFVGRTVEAIAVQAMSADPTPATTMRSAIPPNVDAAVRKCLEKLPADRFQSAGRLAEALADPDFRHREHVYAAGAARRWRRRAVVGWSVAALFGLGLAATQLPSPPEPARSSIMGFVPSQRPVSGLNNFSISNDGSSFAFVGGSPSQIWIKEDENPQARPVPGTGGARALTFSPDGSAIAFQRGTGLFRVSSFGGGDAVELVADSVSPDLPGLAWLDDGRVVYASTDFFLRAVPAGGGPTEVLNTREVPELGTRALGFPTALPGARGVLFSGCTVDCRNVDLAVLDLETGENRLLVRGAGTGWFVEGGTLAYVSTEGSLYVVPFDLETLAPVGEARLVREGLSVELGRAGAVMSASGDLVYREPNLDDRAERTLQWVDLAGNAVPFDPEWRAHFEQVVVSPDGRKIAAAIRSGDRLDIWTRDMDGSPPVRLTFEGDNHRPSWTADGRFVVFLSNRRTAPSGGRFWEVWRKAADGSAPPELVYSRSAGGSDIEEASPGPDPWLAITSHDPQDANYNVFAARSGADEVLVRISATAAIEGNPKVSPDGNWVAYYSDETGTGEVYVRSFPDPEAAGRRQISNGPSGFPVWAGDGSALFHGTADAMVRTEISLDGGLSTGATTELFSRAPYVFEEGVATYGVTPEGDRLLMIRAGDLSASGIAVQDRLVWVSNWTTEVRAILDGG